MTWVRYLHESKPLFVPIIEFILSKLSFVPICLCKRDLCILYGGVSRPRRTAPHRTRERGHLDVARKGDRWLMIMEWRRPRLTAGRVQDPAGLSASDGAGLWTRCPICRPERVRVVNAVNPALKPTTRAAFTGVHVSPGCDDGMLGRLVTAAAMTLSTV